MKNALIGLAAVVILGAGAWYVASQQGFSIGDRTVAENNADQGSVVARVNGEEISRDDVTKFQEQFASSQGIDLASLDAEIRAQFESQAVEALVSQELLKQAVARSGVTVSNEQVDAELQTVRSQFPDEATYESTLASEGMTEAQLREQIHTGLAAQEYLEQELNLSAITVTDEEVSALYENLAAGGEAPSLEEVRPQVEAMLLQQKQQEKIVAHIAELRSQADVQIFI